MAEVVPLNIAQQLFLVLFSILYGIMLQSIMGLKPFPLARTFKGYVPPPNATPIEKIIADKKFKDKCEGKKKNELICMWRKRVILSIAFLNILPLLYFLIFLSGLSKVSIARDFSSLCDFIKVVFIFWSALGVFGFYRIYHAMAVKYWETLFCDVELKDRPISYDAWAHLLWGGLYLLPLPFLILVNSSQTLLGLLVMCLTSFLVWVICASDC